MIFAAGAVIAVQWQGIARVPILRRLLAMMLRGAKEIGTMRVVVQVSVRPAPFKMTVPVPLRLRSILAVSTIRSFVMATRPKAHRVALIHASPMENAMQTRIAIMPA